MSKGGQSYGVNPMQNAAQGFNDAFSALANGNAANGMFLEGGVGQYDPMTYNPALVNKTASYNPATMNAATAGSTGFAAQTANASRGFNPATYNPATQADPAAIASLLKTYMNPFTDQVIDRTAADMNRTNDMQLQNVKANAASSGAFGGGRQGLVEAETMAQNTRAIGDMSAQQRSAGFNTAAGLASQDIANDMAVAGANQNARNSAGQFNAGNTQAARQYAAEAANQNAYFNANQRQDAAMFGADAANTVRMFNAGNQQQANAANMGATNDSRSSYADAKNNMAMFNAGNTMAARQDNQAAANAAGQFNAGSLTDNLQRYITNASNTASGAGNLAQASYGVGNNITQQQQQSGSMTQALQQLLLNQGQDMFAGYTGSPEQQLQMRLAALGMNPLSNAGTTTGTQDNSGQLFGQLLGAASNMVSFNPISLGSVFSG